MNRVCRSPARRSAGRRNSVTSSKTADTTTDETAVTAESESSAGTKRATGTKRAAETKTPAKRSTRKPAVKTTAAKTAASKRATAEAAPAEAEEAVATDEDAVEDEEATEEEAEETETRKETEEVKAKVEDSGGFVFNAAEDDAPAQQVVTAGATADPVKDYLKQIGKVALLNAAQEVELAERIEAGLFAEQKLKRDESIVNTKAGRELAIIVQDGRAAKDHLLEANLPMMVSEASCYTDRGMLFMDLIQEGNLGLIRAVEKFDYSKGYKFSTYATWWIRQAIPRAMADQARTIRIPVHMVEVINKLARVQRQMLQDLGREPTPEELAKELDMTPERVVEVQKYGREPIDRKSTRLNSSHVAISYAV